MDGARHPAIVDQHSAGQVLAAGDGGDVESPDLPDGLLADDEALDGLVDFKGDEENDIINGKPTGDEECQPLRVLKDPGMPSQKDIDEHEAGGHATDRMWWMRCWRATPQG